MTVEHAHSVDNGVYQQQLMPPSGGPCNGSAGLGPAIVEYLDEEHGGYKVPEAVSSITSATTFGAKFRRMLVLHDFQNAEVWRAAVFEGMATFVMMFVGILCTISTLESGFSHPVVAVAVSQGLVLALCILAAAPASGAHVNPAITWTEMLTGHITPVRAALYIIAQTLGSIVASLAAKAIVGNAVALRYSLGGCYLTSQVSATSGVVGMDTNRAFLLETGLTFFVLFIAYSIALDPPRLPRTGYTLAPFLIGAVVGLGIFTGGSLVSGYGGAGINPGRCIGPAVALGGSMWTGHWVFWAGPALAGLAMAALYHNIPPTHVQVYKLRKAARAKAKKSASKGRSRKERAMTTSFGCANGSRIRLAFSSDRNATSENGEKPEAV
ncbi:hypothetical protein KC19_3G109600 [Ceratodon purpureus]|uniref:Aquaporin n=2 Tax=Ceratodon purpureus TaxID=3225 RepID=A0A8T0IIG6_CERPU|nr:hypothetical protein KC19_3G109600 [Ceratodon purpureus]